MFRAVLAVSLIVFAQTPWAASFNCAKAGSLSEMSICNDPELSRLDDELAKIYQQAKAHAADKDIFRQQTQAAWKWREKNCQSRECLISWYAQRKITLEKIAETTADAKCLVYGPVKLRGFVVSQTLSLEPDGRQSTVYLLNVKAPVCVHVEPIDIGEPRDVSVTRFQLVGYSENAYYKNIEKYLFKEVTISGSLSTDNVTQYYAESNAIDIGSISPP